MILNEYTLIIILAIVIIVFILVIIVIINKAKLNIKSKLGEISIGKNSENSINVTKISDNLFCISQLKIDQIVEDEIKLNDKIHYLRKHILEKQMIIVERNKNIIIFKIMDIVKKEFAISENDNKYKLLKLVITSGMVEFIDKFREILKENHLYNYKNENEWTKYLDFACDYIFGSVQTKITDISFVMENISRSEFLSKCGEKIKKINDEIVRNILNDCKEISIDFHKEIHDNITRQKEIKLLKGG